MFLLLFEWITFKKVKNSENKPQISIDCLGQLRKIFGIKATVNTESILYKASLNGFSLKEQSSPKIAISILGTCSILECSLKDLHFLNYMPKRKKVKKNVNEFLTF